MALSFKCPSCGGPLETDGGDLMVRCPFCSNSVIVPEELRSEKATRPESLSMHEQFAQLAELGQLIRSGNLVAAIKVYRDIFHVGLKEARNAVEKLAGGKPVEVSSRVQIGDHSQSSAHQAHQTPYVTLPQSHVSSHRRGCLIFALIALLSLGGIIFIGGLAGYFFVRRPATDNGAPRTEKQRIPIPTDTRTSPPKTQGFARVVLSFGSDGIGPGQFKDARSVGVDGAGNIYAADYTGGRVQVFDSTGKFITQWMVDAKMPLLKLTADRKGVVYVVQHGEINRYEGLTGRFLGKVEGAGRRGFDDVTVMADGGLVAVQNGQDILTFDPGGRLVNTISKSITEQTGDSELDARVAVDGLGNIYALGRFNDAVFKFSRAGKFINRIGGKGEEPGLFRAPHTIAVDGQGRVYVSDVKGIQVFDTNGRYLDVFDVEKSVAFGMFFNDKNELFVAARTQVVKFSLNK